MYAIRAASMCGILSIILCNSILSFIMTNVEELTRNDGGLAQYVILYVIIENRPTVFASYYKKTTLIKSTPSDRKSLHYLGPIDKL